MRYSCLAIIACICLLTAPANAQDNSTGLSINKADYSTAIGVRAGGTSGLTIKHFVGQQSALEGIISVWPDALGGTLLYERHVPAFDVSGLNWYYGAGGHAIFEVDRIYYNDRGRYYTREGSLGLGVDGIVGMEYKIPPIPFALSLDIKPFMEVNTAGGLWFAMDPGLGIKVAF